MQPHQVYIDDLLLPVTPSKITIKKDGKNRTVDLINGDQLNLINKPKLTEFSFEFLIPHEKIPASTYFIEPEKVINKLEKIRDEKKTVPFIIIRDVPGLTSSIIEEVTLESVEELEDTKNGRDYLIKVDLKEYIPIKTQEIKVKKENGILKAVKRTFEQGAEQLADKYIIKKGDTAATIAMKLTRTTATIPLIMQATKSLKPNVMPEGATIDVRNLNKK